MRYWKRKENKNNDKNQKGWKLLKTKVGQIETNKIPKLSNF
jgi:hypothetical protein